MALTVFFAICILGVDFLIYTLLQWTWGDKRRAIARQVAAHLKAFDAQSGRAAPAILASLNCTSNEPR